MSGKLAQLCAVLFLAVALKAQVTSNPASGSNVNTGSSVVLTNNDPSTGTGTLKDENGNTLATFLVFSGGTYTVEIPNSDALKGHDIKIEVCTAQACYSFLFHVK